MASRIKNSVGIWLFGAGISRYMPGGYHPELKSESIVERTARVVDGMGDMIDGLEYHYPGEIHEENVGPLQDVLGTRHDIYCVSSELPKRLPYAKGALTNSDPAVRDQALAESYRAIDLCAAVGAKFNYWSGSEGYDYPFQLPYSEAWRAELDGVAAIAAYAHDKGVPMVFETKAYGPANNILVRNVSTAMFVIKKVGELGVPTDHMGVNLDWQHLHATREGLAESAALLANEGMLAHNHANAGWGIADEANLPGTTYFMRTLELLMVLQDVGYGSRGERIGYDAGPGTHAGIPALRQSILQVEFMAELASRIDREAMRQARLEHDAVSAYREVYRVLGLDRSMEQRLLEAHQSR
jgi:xylose isomerase